MKLKLKINVEPLWTVGVRPVGSTDEFDFRNKKDIGMVHIDKIKSSLHCDLSDSIIKENAPYLVAFALDDKTMQNLLTNGLVIILKSIATLSSNGVEFSIHSNK